MSTAVLLMAYGSPRSLDEVEPYYTEIRGGRAPSAGALADLRARYERIGGGSPLTEITRRQAAALQGVLDAASPGAYRTYVGMKHWHPFIREAVAEIRADGAERVIGLVLAPHFSRISIGGYALRLHAAREAVEGKFEVRMIPSWYADPGFVAFAARNLRRALDGWNAADPKLRVLFTAHSLPARILDEADPYRDQLLDSSRLVAETAGTPHWELAFQSASHTGEPWLGPDVLDRLDAFAGEGGHHVVVAPIGFVADHLEVLYDVDVECAERAAKLGLELRRVDSPNDDPDFIQTLAVIVREGLSG
ncbi:MAG: ferrochelatase [Actinomycetota bacterium]